MKSSFVAAVAAMAGAATANSHAHRHAHDLFKKGADVASVCVPGCTTIWTTITGEPTLVPVPVTTTTATHTNTTTVVVTPKPTSTEVVIVVPVPTPEPRTCPTPGTYTFPATTVTVSKTTTVCAATSTKVPAGTHTVGGHTTIVKTATTITCPVATVTTSGTVTTSTISSTVFVCPSAGTYTVAPITTVVTEETVIVYPVPTSYVPGTYTVPEQVVTVTETDFVTYCPYTSSGLVSSTPAPPPPPPVETKPAPPPAPKPAAPKPKPAPKPAAPSTGDSGLRSDNDHLGITYTPYQPTNGDCKTAGEVDQDIANLKQAGFKTIRVYSTDCNTLESVGTACEKYGLDLIIGVFVKAGYTCSYDYPEIKKQVDDIVSWGKFGIVKLFVVSNEAIMNGYCSAAELRQLITTVKSKCSGYKGPWTIAETLNIWQDKEVSSAICDVVDVTGANIHAYFNPNVKPEDAGDFVSSQLDILGEICPGNLAISLETGWPNQGNANGEARAGVSEQKTAISSIRKACGNKVIFFSYENDQWKEPGSCDCERNWGSAAAFDIKISIGL